MKVYPTANNLNRKNILFYTKLFLILFTIFFISFSVLAFPEYSSEGIKTGINLCFEKLIPSLFPFMIISSFLLKSEAYMALSVLFRGLTEKLFRLPENTLPIILMSFISGYPIGAIMTYTLFEKGKITYEDAKQLMTFCINPSISFCLSFIGSFLYGSIKIGLIIYSSSILSSAIIGFAYGRLKKGYLSFTAKEQKNNENLKISVAFSESVTESTAAITAICITVIIFSCLINLINIFTDNLYIHSVLSFILEITNFAQNNFCFVSLCIMSAATSFGGICTHFQIMPYLLKMKISYKHFLFFRILNMLLSYIISLLLINVFPTVMPTSVSTFDKTALTNAGVPVSCTLIAMAAIIIFTDNAIARIKEREKI